jgi:hypothetical protein
MANSQRRKIRIIEANKKTKRGQGNGLWRGVR